MKKLKLWNGRDWDCRGGHLYVAAHSVRDAVDLANEAYRRKKGLTDRPDITAVTAHEVKIYWHKDCWGNAMEGITPERGVWRTEQSYGKEKPEKLV